MRQIDSILILLRFSCDSVTLVGEKLCADILGYAGNSSLVVLALKMFARLPAGMKRFCFCLCFVLYSVSFYLFRVIPLFPLSLLTPRRPSVPSIPASED
jgi:hypothetical protein